MDSDDATLLRETVDEFFRRQLRCGLRSAGRIQDDQQGQLQEETYDEVRDPGHSYTRISSRTPATKPPTPYRVSFARWKQGEYAGKPHFSKPTAVYNKQCATFHDDHVSLATIDGRIEIEYVLPNDDRDTPHSWYLDNDDYDVTGAELHNKDRE